MNNQKTVAILYTHLPHYRIPVFRELIKSKNYKYKFFFDPRGVDATIHSGQLDGNHSFIRTYKIGPFLFQPGFFYNALFGRNDAVIFLGNPYILTNWVYAIVLRLRRRKVLFWTHGWLNKSNNLREKIRHLYYLMANKILLYGERARDICLARGISLDRIQVIYNSLDYDTQSAIRDNASPILRKDKQFFLCVSRLIPDVEIDLAIRALAIVNKVINSSIALIVVGDGPERDRLSTLARVENVDVVFKGAIYDEETLSKLFMTSHAVISPGKVGLLAMHALAYGAPVITHGDFDHQMPEVEAIVPGLTGDFFNRGDVASLATVTLKWLSYVNREEVRAEAIRTIEERYTPEIQRNLIEAALNEIL